MRGDFGYSYDTKRPVTAEIADRLPATLYLMGVTFVVVLAIAIRVGILCAVKQYSWLDIVISTSLRGAGAAGLLGRADADHDLLRFGAQPVHGGAAASCARHGHLGRGFQLGDRLGT